MNAPKNNLARAFAFIMTIIISTVQPSAIATDATDLSKMSSNNLGVLKFLVSLCNSPNPFSLSALDKVVGAKSKYEPYSYHYKEKLPIGIRDLQFWDEEPGPGSEIADITIGLDHTKVFITAKELADTLHLVKDKQILTTVANTGEIIYQMPWGALGISGEKSIFQLELLTTSRFKSRISYRNCGKASPILFGHRSTGVPGNPIKAIPFLNEAISFNPSNYHAYSMRASANLQTNNFETALSDINRALELTKDRPNYSYYLQKASIERKMHSYDAALENCNQALGLAKGEYDQSRVHAQRGLIYFDKHQYPEAISDYKDAEKPQPTAELLLRRAQAENELGNNVTAYVYYKKAAQAMADMEYYTGCTLPPPVRRPRYYTSSKFVDIVAEDLLHIMTGPSCDKDLEKLDLYTSRSCSGHDLYFDLMDVAHSKKDFDLDKYGLTQADLRHYFPNSLRAVEQRIANKPSTDMVDYRRLPDVEQWKMMNDED